MNKLVVDSVQGEVLEPLRHLLWKWNQAHNLFSRRLKPNDLAERLLECLAFAPFLPPGCRVADLGSGAGLPGLPLAMIRPDLELTLVEPRAKRCTWLRYAAQQLDLPLTVIEGRWDPSWTDFDRVISRAVFPPAEFLEAVGALASVSVQMTGPDPGHVEDRQRYEIWLDGQSKGSILAGVKLASIGV